MERGVYEDFCYLLYTPIVILLAAMLLTCFGIRGRQCLWV